MPFTSVTGASSVIKPGVVTSSTRPSAPYVGQMIFETDTLTTLIYNGSAWVCITPKGSTVLTDQSTSSTTFTDLATAGPTVTINTGSSALVTVSATTYRASGTGNTSLIGVNVSGATTRAASSDYGARTSYFVAGTNHVMAAQFVMTGLTPGTNVFKLQYYIDSAAVTVNFLNRYITVVGIP